MRPSLQPLEQPSARSARPDEIGTEPAQGREGSGSYATPRDAGDRGRTTHQRQDRNMTVYALIDDDQQIHVRDGEWMPELGPEGFDRVPLHPGTGMAAFVNDCGFRLTDRYRRNILGALMAIRLGAALRPLAGPVVFTGWNDAGCGSEIRPLTPDDIQSVQAIHRDFTTALDGTHSNPAWAGKVRAAAEELRGMQTPTVTLIGGF